MFCVEKGNKAFYLEENVALFEGQKTVAARDFNRISSHCIGIQIMYAVDVIRALKSIQLRTKARPPPLLVQQSAVSFSIRSVPYTTLERLLVNLQLGLFCLFVLQ